MPPIKDYELIETIQQIDENKIRLIEDNDKLLRLRSPHFFEVCGRRKESYRHTLNYTEQGICNLKDYELVLAEICGNFLVGVPLDGMGAFADYASERFKEANRNVIRVGGTPRTLDQEVLEYANTLLVVNFLIEKYGDDAMPKLSPQPASITYKNGRTRSGSVLMGGAKEFEGLRPAMEQVIEATKSFNRHARDIRAGKVVPKVVA